MSDGKPLHTLRAMPPTFEEFSYRPDPAKKSATLSLPGLWPVASRRLRSSPSARSFSG